jgi:hypothetical protein
MASLSKMASLFCAFIKAISTIAGLVACSQAAGQR